MTQQENSPPSGIQGGPLAPKLLCWILPIARGCDPEQATFYPRTHTAPALGTVSAGAGVRIPSPPGCQKLPRLLNSFHTSAEGSPILSILAWDFLALTDWLFPLEGGFVSGYLKLCCTSLVRCTKSLSFRAGRQNVSPATSH